MQGFWHSEAKANIDRTLYVLSTAHLMAPDPCTVAARAVAGCNSGTPLALCCCAVAAKLRMRLLHPKAAFALAFARGYRQRLGHQSLTQNLIRRRSSARRKHRGYTTAKSGLPSICCHSAVVPAEDGETSPVAGGGHRNRFVQCTRIGIVWHQHAWRCGCDAESIAGDFAGRRRARSVIVRMAPVQQPLAAARGKCARGGMAAGCDTISRSGIWMALPGGARHACCIAGKIHSFGRSGRW